MSQEITPGTILAGRYRINAVLGQGGFGITYQAENISLGNLVCVKELFIGGVCTRTDGKKVVSQGTKDLSFSDFKSRFINEARELAKFSHPGIVRVTDVFEENETAYFVMDYVKGETLKNLYQKKGRLSPSECVDLMKGILDATEEVHKHGMLHRDIKPDNILITPEGKSVLIDFGSARQFGSGNTITQTAIITPGYAPIEQYSDRAKRGPFTDIYSIGATFYFLLTGQKPIPATDRNLETLVPPDQLNPLVSRQLSSVIMLAMELKPENRFQTVAELRTALDSALQSAPELKEDRTLQKTVKINTDFAKTPDAAPLPKASRSGNKKPAYIALAVAAILAVLAVIFVYTNKSAPAKIESPDEIATKAIEMYYGRLEKGKGRFNTDDLFAENVEQFLTMKNTNPVEINKNLDDYFWYHYLDRKYTIVPGTLHANLLSNGGLEVDFDSEENYFQVEKQRKMRVFPTNHVEYNAEMKITKWAYTKVK